MSDSTSSEFSNFGKYNILESLDLILPENKIHIEKVADNVFSYLRQDSNSKITEKMIPSNSEQLSIEIVPIRPLNYPARRTNQVYLKFDKTIRLASQSATTFLVYCPIEVGIFALTEKGPDPIDCFSCDQINSRFGLLGTPDNGKLCKFFKTKIVGSEEKSTPFFNSIMKVTIENQTDVGHNIEKAVFQITDNEIYYQNSNAIIDSLKITLKTRGKINFADHEIEPIATDWIKSPPWEPTTKSPILELGVD